MKKSILIAMIAGSVSLGLSACGDAASETEVAALAADTIEGVEISDARLILPAVAGNPAAVYFTLTNGTDRNLAFRSAEVSSAARAEVHDMMELDGEMVMGEAPPVMVQTGSDVTFEPGGKHVMAFELEEGFGEGDTTTVTLIAAGGVRHAFEATAQAAGDDR